MTGIEGFSVSVQISGQIQFFHGWSGPVTKPDAYVLGNNKDFTLTFIQVICALAVVTLHTNICFWEFSATERYWFTANIIECVFYFAVPVFFMITGITLIDYQDKYTTLEFFKRRIRKSVVPYIAWSSIGVVFLVATKSIPARQVTASWIIAGLLSTNGIIGVYWFFKPLYCAYLSIPLFSAVEKEKKKRMAEYLLIISFLINILPPFLTSVLHSGFVWPYEISVVSGILFWVWGGYYLYYYPPGKIQKTILIGLSALGLLLHIIGTYAASVQAGSLQQLYKGYTNLPCVLYVPGVFCVLRKTAEKIAGFDRLKRMIECLGKYTFSVYLLHWFVLRLMDFTNIFDYHSIIYRLFAPFLVYGLVSMIVWFMRKNRWLARIVP